MIILDTDHLTVLAEQPDLEPVAAGSDDEQEHRSWTPSRLTMTVQITDDQERILREFMRSGEYADERQVIDDVLVALKLRNRLRDTLQVGLDELDRGEGISGSEVIAELRKRFEETEPTHRRYSLEALRDQRDSILKLAAKYGASNVRVFGSVARGDSDEISDVDLLVDLEPKRSLLDRAGLQIDLEELLHVHVDVATVAGLKPRIREKILKETVPL